MQPTSQTQSGSRIWLCWPLQPPNYLPSAPQLTQAPARLWVPFCALHGTQTFSSVLHTNLMSKESNLPWTARQCGTKSTRDFTRGGLAAHGTMST